MTDETRAQGKGRQNDGRRAQLIKGVLDLALLAILRERPRYGLEILQCMNEEGGLDVADGTIYPLLHRMEANGFVTSEWRIDADQARPRKYYALTRKGTAELASLAEDWKELRVRVDALVKKGTK